MGHSKASKASTHERIVDIAAQRFCELGIEGLSIANLMSEAGLTHGGFYKHFASRDALVNEALAAAFQRTKSAPRSYKTSFQSLVLDYLSLAHRDARPTGCAVAALVNDVGRLQGEAKKLYTDRLLSSFKSIARLLGELEGDTTSDRRADALVVFSSMVGALGLSRAVADEALSQEILSTVSADLLRRFVPAALPSEA